MPDMPECPWNGKVSRVAKIYFLDLSLSGEMISDTSSHGLQVLKFYNLEGQSKWMNLLYETCFLVLFLILAWCGTTLTFAAGMANSACRSTKAMLVFPGIAQSSNRSPMNLPTSSNAI